MMLIRITITGVLLAAAGIAAAAGVEITEWQVPWPDTRPRDPYVGPEGEVWFVGQTGDYVASLDPGDGNFERYALDAGAGPHNLVVDDAGTVWYAGNRDAHIGRLNPDTRNVRKFPMPGLEARDPHTLALGPEEDIWFTVQGGNFVGRFDRRGGKIDLIEVPTIGARPYGIVVADDGRPWFTEFGSNKLGTVDPETLALKEIELPRDDARPRRLAITSNGHVWYVDYARGYLGRLEPDSGHFEEWRVPGGTDAQPYGMAVDDRDRLWFVETGSEPNRFVGFDPASEQFLDATEIESGGGTVRHMYYHAPTDSVWFGTDTNTIGRADVG
ncbi:MAG: lyase [Gammaproteobacteria bacterium]|nr:lyase [Gammaproteobacteria bacterium]